MIPPDTFGPHSLADGSVVEVHVDKTIVEVIDVNVESCTGGNAALRKSVENAVWASSPLPDAPDPALFDRRIRFFFRPS